MRGEAEVETPIVEESQPETASSKAEEEAPASASSTPPIEEPADTQLHTNEAAPTDAVLETTQVSEPIAVESPQQPEVPDSNEAVSDQGAGHDATGEEPPSKVTASVATPASDPPGSLPNQELIARDVALTWSNTVELLRFVRFTDFVLCDFNQDGIADVLGLSSRMSTGYGFRGIGNGLFAEGPSFDLPFRPAAAVSLGNYDETINGLFLVSASGLVSMFYPLTGEDPSTGITPNSFSVYRIDTETGPIFAVHGDGETFVRVFLASDRGLQDLGEHPAIRSADIRGWYGDIVAWSYLDQAIPFPLPPSGAERTTRIADLNGDGILDLVYFDSGRIVCLLSRDGEPLMEEQTVRCSAQPVSIRIADIDGNGFPDVLALIGTSGTLEVYLTTPK